MNFRFQYSVSLACDLSSTFIALKLIAGHQEGIKPVKRIAPAIFLAFCGTIDYNAAKHGKYPWPLRFKIKISTFFTIKI